MTRKEQAQQLVAWADPIVFDVAAGLGFHAEETEMLIADCSKWLARQVEEYLVKDPTYYQDVLDELEEHA